MPAAKKKIGTFFLLTTMSKFIYDDGSGKLADEEGNEVYEFDMEIDQEMYPIENVTNFDTYLDLKPPEKEKKRIIKQEINTIETKSAPVGIRGPYKHYKDAEKEKLFELVYLNGVSVRSAALKLNIKPRTANNWINNFEKEPKDFTERKSGSGRLK